MKMKESLISCGVSEISGLYASPTTLVTGVFRDIEWEEVEDKSCPRDAYGDRDYKLSGRAECGPAFILFSDIAGPKNNASKLIDYIKKFKLGTVNKSSTAKNPNTGNPIQVYVWKINHKNLFKHCE